MSKDKELNLRDNFAIGAPEMPGWWIYKHIGQETLSITSTKRLREIETSWRYQWADAMLETRSPKENGLEKPNPNDMMPKEKEE